MPSRLNEIVVSVWERPWWALREYRGVFKLAPGNATVVHRAQVGDGRGGTAMATGSIGFSASCPRVAYEAVSNAEPMTRRIGQAIKRTRRDQPLGEDCEARDARLRRITETPAPPAGALARLAGT